MLQLVGCHHQAIESRLRGQLAIAPARLPEALRRFRDRFPLSEGVLLSTCNRTEIYTAAASAEHLPSNQELADYLAGLNGLRGEDVCEYVFHSTGAAAVRHLFRVASSLDSMLIGDAQILHQVKQAYRLASAGAHTGAMTHAAFQSAIRVAKRIARETTLHQRRVSLASIAIRELARQVFERFDDKQILVIGAGETANEALRCLREEGARLFTIVNRNRRRAESLADRYGGRAAGFDQLDRLLSIADLVVSATSAREPVVTAETYQQITACRYQRSQFILDLAVPADFEAGIGRHPSVFLYTLDDLKVMCQRNRDMRSQELPLANEIIEDETQQFMLDLVQRATTPTIRQLRDQAHQVKRDEVTRLFNRLASIDPAERTEIERSFDRLVNKLLHPPLESLKEETSAQHRAWLLEAVRRLFQLDP